MLELSNRAARIGFWEVDLESSRLTWSAVTREIHDVPSDFEPNLTSAMGFYREGASRDRLRAAMAAAIALGEPYDLELQMMTSRGDDRWIRTIGLPEMIDGRCGRLYGTFQDIDIQVRAGEARLAQARAEAANRGRSEFLSKMSHELRTPLNAVLGFAQLLAADPDEQLSPRQEARILYIEHAGTKLLGLIDDLLKLSTLDSGQIGVRLESVEVGPLLDEALRIVGDQALTAGVAIKRYGRADGLTVSADRTGLCQCIVNLLRHAINLRRPDGLVAIRVHDQGAMVAVSIGDPDQGGVTQSLLRRFEPFLRLGARSNGVNGTGGQGSCFTLKMPRREPGAGPADPSGPGSAG
jgi:signal transduction histidine kinase